MDKKAVVHIHNGVLTCKSPISLLFNNVILRVIKVQIYDFFIFLQQKNDNFF